MISPVQIEYTRVVPVTNPPRLPRPSWDDLSTRAELSTARQRVLDEVETAHRPLRTAEVADRLGLHHNTVREHLDALVEAGFVRATPETTGRRGRPALLYSSTAPDPGEVLDSYLALLDAVAESLGDGEAAETMAREIGRRWARGSSRVTAPASSAPDSPCGAHTASSTTQVQPAASPTGSQPAAWPGPAASASTKATTSRAAAALSRLVPELSRMGFAPEADGERLILRACPLITGTRVPHDLVCVMHEAYLAEVCAQHTAPVGQPAPVAPGSEGSAGCGDALAAAPAGVNGDNGVDSADSVVDEDTVDGCHGRLVVAPLLADGCHVGIIDEP